MMIVNTNQYTEILLFASFINAAAKFTSGDFEIEINIFKI
jgi:hypothetical protein